MIRVLQDGKKVGRCYTELCADGRPLHETAQKNRDHYLLQQTLASTVHEAKSVDFGRGASYTLQFLSALGLGNLIGIDRTIALRLRFARLAQMARQRKLRSPYSLMNGDILTRLMPPESCDVIVSISTIEHGLSVASFMQQITRLLIPGGIAVITTEYWETKIDTSSKHACGLPWCIFSRSDVEDEVLAEAARAGLGLLEPAVVPRCGEPTVCWNGCYYTFIACGFRKNGHQA